MNPLIQFASGQDRFLDNFWHFVKLRVLNQYFLFLEFFLENESIVITVWFLYGPATFDFQAQFDLFEHSLTYPSTVWPIRAQFDLSEHSLTYPSTVWPIRAQFDLSKHSLTYSIIVWPIPAFWPIKHNFLYSCVGASVLYCIVLKHNSISLKIVELKYKNVIKFN